MHAMSSVLYAKFMPKPAFICTFLKAGTEGLPDDWMNINSNQVGSISSLYDFNHFKS